MPFEFTAEQVTASDEEWGRLVLFESIEEMDGSPYLMFQGQYEYSEEDVRLGQNQPYVEIQNQGWSWYGHINKVELERTSLTLQMDEEAQSHMEQDGFVTVRFQLGESEFGRLKAQLARILGKLLTLRPGEA